MKPTGLKAMLPELSEQQHKWLQGYITEQKADEILNLQKDIVGVDKYRIDIDQQVYAYARVHRLADDRIAELTGKAEGK